MATIKKYFNFFIVVILLPLLVYGSIWLLDQRGFFLIKQIVIQVESIESQKSYSAVYVQNLKSHFDFFKGKSLWKTSLSEFSIQLRKQAWIADFKVQRSWPSQIEIQIVAKKIAYLATTHEQINNGEFNPISTDAEILPKIDSRQAPAVALLKGEVFLKNEEKRKKAIELLDALPAKGRVGVSELSEVNYNSKNGFWIKVIHSPYEIHLGEDQFSMKTSRVSQVIDYLEKRDLKARVIDANLSKKVLVRMQQSP